MCAALISVPRLPRGTVNAAICSLMWEVTRDQGNEYRGRRVSTLLVACGHDCACAFLLRLVSSTQAEFEDTAGPCSNGDLVERGTVWFALRSWRNS